MKAWELGRNGEVKAKEFLESQGLTIITTNFHSRFGEIDIVAKSDGVIHFIEVKTSSKYDAIERITPSKYAKILKTIEYYLYKHPIDMDFQLDAVVIRNSEVEWIKNISY